MVSEQARRFAMCGAQQHGDAITCHRCARTWDTNDLAPPYCPSQPAAPKAPRTMLLRAALYAVTIGLPVALAWSIFG